MSLPSPESRPGQEISNNPGGGFFSYARQLKERVETKVGNIRGVASFGLGVSALGELTAAVFTLNRPQAAMLEAFSGIGLYLVADNIERDIEDPFIKLDRPSPFLKKVGDTLCAVEGASQLLAAGLMDAAVATQNPLMFTAGLKLSMATFFLSSAHRMDFGALIPGQHSRPSLN